MEMVKNIHINMQYLLLLGITPNGLGSLKAVTEIRILHFYEIIYLKCFVSFNSCVFILVSIEKDGKVNLLGHVKRYIV